MNVRNIGAMIGSAAAGSHGDAKKTGAPLRSVERPPPKPVPTDGWNGASNIQGKGSEIEAVLENLEVCQDRIDGSLDWLDEQIVGYPLSATDQQHRNELTNTLQSHNPQYRERQLQAATASLSILEEVARMDPEEEGLVTLSGQVIGEVRTDLSSSDSEESDTSLEELEGGNRVLWMLDEMIANRQDTVERLQETVAKGVLRGCEAGGGATDSAVANAWASAAAWAEQQQEGLYTEQQFRQQLVHATSKIQSHLQAR